MYRVTFSGAIIDLDGTVYLGDSLIPGAEQGIEKLRSSGVDLLFFSNNPTKTPEEFAAHLTELGISVTPHEILTSAVVTREYLLNNHREDDIFVVGERGFTKQISDLSITENPEEADVLVGSIDRSFAYDTLVDALTAYRGKEPTFLGTDPDRAIPVGNGRKIPGSGAIIGAIASTTGRNPDKVLGKPSQYAVDVCLRHLEADPSECLVVGDRLDTDIDMGENAGMTTTLVLTGVDDRDSLSESSIKPDHVLDSLAEVGGLL
ncbi:MAG: HAD-IIA family hydrolase [Halobacteria archaeon]|nr:HAD-IIA family hydrolase [Halobacteria archaeon]